MNLKTLICGLTVATLGLGARADVIYDSFPGTLNQFSMANGLEIGNEISLNPLNTWTLTNFTIEYYSMSLSPSVAIDVKFYKMNSGTFTNGFQQPGDLFFDSGFFSPLPATGYQTLTYASADFSGGVVPLTITLPSDFTFTITFTNMSGGDSVALPLANNQSNSIVQSFGDYWLNNNGNWTLMTNNAAANFVVDFAGTVPEPSTLALAAIGGAALMGINRLRRKR
jgi:hypothetical protein